MSLAADAALSGQAQSSFDRGDQAQSSLTDLHITRALGSDGLMCVPMSTAQGLIGVMLCGLTAAQDVRLGIVDPDGRDGMVQHAREFHEAGIPFVFDPGQGLPMFNGEELLDFVHKADYVAVNDYEGELLQERSGRTLEALAREVKALVVTLGAKGSLIYSGGRRHEIPCIPAAEVVDPTGCADAYPAGLLYGIAEGMDWETTGRLAALLGCRSRSCTAAGITITSAKAGIEEAKPARAALAEALKRPTPTPEPPVETPVPKRGVTWTDYGPIAPKPTQRA